jgi:hypothetical protein
MEELWEEVEDEDYDDEIIDEDYGEKWVKWVMIHDSSNFNLVLAV